MSFRKLVRFNSTISGLFILLFSFQASPVDLIRSNSALIEFAAGDIKKSLARRGYMVSDFALSQLGTAEGNVRIVLATMADNSAKNALAAQDGTLPAGLKAEGFAIRITTQKTTTTYWVIGADDAGAMYGGFEVAEVISLEGLTSLSAGNHGPFTEKRGVKINIPLDVRTPSYADAGDAAQLNMPEMWNMNFWTRYLDHLARDRYNMISLWTLNLFPSMVKVPGFENASLSDVKRTTADVWTWSSDYSLYGDNMYNPELAGKTETLLTMTIDQKIGFWQKVMEYGRDRGIKFYIMTWNVFVNSSGDAGYGLTTAETNAKTKDYFRKSVKALFQTYPLLAGIGVTAGENMDTYTDKEGWLWDTYGQGLLDAVKEDKSNRKYEFIHRQLQTSIKTVKSIFTFSQNTDRVSLDFSYKYAWARLYSNIRPTFIDGQLNGLTPPNRFYLTLRNDDIFNFRFGDPSFIRDFITQMPDSTKVIGFYLGSDGYVWGREFTSTEPELPRQLEVEKHWFVTMLWGRLGYNNRLSDSRIQQIVQARFPQVPAAELLQAWIQASKIIPKVNRTNFINADYSWAPEYCRSRYGVKTTITGTAADAAELKGYAAGVLGKLGSLRAYGGKELRLTLGDMEAMAHLGNFYAELILANAKAAAGHWRQYAAVASSQYKYHQLLGRAGRADWKESFKTFDNSGSPSLSATAGGTILEAESATLTNAQIAAVMLGATGSKYVTPGTGNSSIEWTFAAPKTGEYTLEFRYALSDQFQRNLAVSINNGPADSIQFWNTGGADVWAWDRKTVTLKSGSNTIKLDISGIAPKIDHLNILSAGAVKTIEPAPAKRQASLKSISCREIRFHLPEGMEVKIQLLNLQGRCNYHGTRAFKARGDHSISLMEAGVKPGLYLIKFIAGQHRITRRVIVMK